MKSKNPVSFNRADFIVLLQQRFHQHINRHPITKWETVAQRLMKHPNLLNSLYAMEETGGMPDVVTFPTSNEALFFFDCAPESPSGRRSLCYDQPAWESRKENKPLGSAMNKAAEMGVEILDIEQYRHLQTLGHFDTKTSSWIKTPKPIRQLGGALFAEYRYGTLFTYHNSAPSYYAARGFRALLRFS